MCAHGAARMGQWRRMSALSMNVSGLWRMRTALHTGPSAPQKACDSVWEWTLATNERTGRVAHENSAASTPWSPCKQWATIRTGPSARYECAGRAALRANATALFGDRGKLRRKSALNVCRRRSSINERARKAAYAHSAANAPSCAAKRAAALGKGAPHERLGTCVCPAPRAWCNGDRLFGGMRQSTRRTALHCRRRRRRLGHWRDVDAGWRARLLPSLDGPAGPYQGKCVAQRQAGALAVARAGHVAQAAALRARPERCADRGCRRMAC